MTDERWGVQVFRDGQDVVTIESNHLVGRDLHPGDEDIIRLCAHQLLGFIGAAAAGSLPGAPRPDRITYRCPACGNQTLMVDSIGHFVCSWLKCSNPCAFSDLVDAMLVTVEDVASEPLPGAPPVSPKPIARLDELAALPEGWDSYGAPRISAGAIAAARAFLEKDWSHDAL